MPRTAPWLVPNILSAMAQPKAAETTTRWRFPSIPFREFYLPPFHAAIDAGAATIMTAFDSLNGVPTSANPVTIKQILRKEWGFQGLVDSDWTSIAELIPHGIANDPATAARKAFLAGVEMDMVSSFYHDHSGESCALPRSARSGSGRSGARCSARQVCAGSIRTSLRGRKAGSRCDASAGELSRWRARRRSAPSCC